MAKLTGAGGRVRYGVDGWPYVVGLGGGGLGALVGGALVGARSSRPMTEAAGVAVMVGGGASLVCAGLGLAYTARGKFRLRDRLLDLVAWRGDEVVLDVGAGAGLLGIGAAHRVPRGRVHCIDLWVGKDLSNNSMDRLRRNASIEGVSERVDARRVDARELHLSDGSVDVVLSTLCLHNLGEVVARKQAALEIVRVLAGRGTVVISDLAGVDELAKWFAAEGLVVQPVRPAAGTFPPQRILVARRD